MHSLLTLWVQRRLTSNFNEGKICNTEGPKKEAKETMETKTQHTSNNINNQATSHNTATHNNNMHARLSTQISRKLWYYGLTCCGCVHESESTCGRSWRNQGYTKRWLNTSCNWMIKEARTDLVIMWWNTKVMTTSSSSVRRGTVHVQRRE